MNALRFAALAAALIAAGAAGAGRIDIVSEAQLGQSWRPDPNQKHFVAGYPEAAADKSRDVCVNLGYLIKADGSTSNFTEMKVWSSGAADGTPSAEVAEAYVQLAAAVVSRWRFVPVARPRSIYTSASFAFDGSKSLGSAGILERCRIDDLPAFFARTKTCVENRGELFQGSQGRTCEERPRDAISRGY